MATTGEYGYCIGKDDVCLDYSSPNGAEFTTATSGFDWSTSNMPCYGNPSATCPVKNSCVCKWSFVSFLERVDGCDSIPAIKCDAVNLKSLEAIANLAGGQGDINGKYTNAMNCIYSSCY